MTTTSTTARRAVHTKGAEIRIDLDASFAAVLDELAEVTATKLAAEKREKEIKAQLLAEAGYSPDENDVKRVFMVYVDGGLRKKIKTQQRHGINVKLLAEAFPEAHSVCETTSTFGVIASA